MPIRSKPILALLSALLTMSVCVASAPARQFTTSNQQFRAIWTPLAFTALGGFIQVRCNVTLRGSFHYRTSSKTRGALAGYITSAALTRPCSGGEAWILNGTERATNTLPWHISYDSFTGTLPRIRTLRTAVIGGSFLLLALGNGCRYQSTAASPGFGRINLNELTGEANSLQAENSSSIPLSETLAGSCPASGSFTGTTSTYDNGEGGRITIRLI